MEQIRLGMNLYGEKCKAIINNLGFRNSIAKLLPTSQVNQRKITCFSPCSGTKRNNISEFLIIHLISVEM